MRHQGLFKFLSYFLPGRPIFSYMHGQKRHALYAKSNPCEPIEPGNSRVQEKQGNGTLNTILSELSMLIRK